MAPRAAHEVSGEDLGLGLAVDVPCVELRDAGAILIMREIAYRPRRACIPFSA